MQFLAGTGHHDLQSVCEIELPTVIRGWTDIDLSGAGGPKAVKEGEREVLSDVEDEGHDDDDEDMVDATTSPRRRAARLAARKERKAWKKLGTGPTLRCFLVQLRILENNQNGKDTHLRGLQLFARDESYVFTRRKPARGIMQSPQDIEGNDNNNSMWADEVEAGRADDLSTGPITRSRAKRKARASAIAGEVIGVGGGDVSISEVVGTPEGKMARGHDLMRELEMKFGEPELR